MKLGRATLFVQFAALWKIYPTFYPDSKTESCCGARAESRDNFLAA